LHFEFGRRIEECRLANIGFAYKTNEHEAYNFLLPELMSFKSPPIPITDDKKQRFK
jgi:hypothetical protein